MYRLEFTVEGIKFGSKQTGIGCVVGVVRIFHASNPTPQAGDRPFGGTSALDKVRELLGPFL